MSRRRASSGLRVSSTKVLIRGSALEDRHVPCLDRTVQPRGRKHPAISISLGQRRKLASGRGREFLVPKIEYLTMPEKGVGKNPRHTADGTGLCGPADEFPQRKKWRVLDQPVRMRPSC